MKCPKCDLLTSNTRDECPRCGVDLRPLKDRLGIKDAPAPKSNARSRAAKKNGTDAPQSTPQKKSSLFGWLRGRSTDSTVAEAPPASTAVASQKAPSGTKKAVPVATSPDKNTVAAPQATPAPAKRKKAKGHADLTEFINALEMIKGGMQKSAQTGEAPPPIRETLDERMINQLLEALQTIASEDQAEAAEAAEMPTNGSGHVPLHESSAEIDGAVDDLLASLSFGDIEDEPQEEAILPAAANASSSAPAEGAPGAMRFTTDLDALTRALDAIGNELMTADFDEPHASSVMDAGDQQLFADSHESEMQHMQMRGGILDHLTEDDDESFLNSGMPTSDEGEAEVLEEEQEMEADAPVEEFNDGASDAAFAALAASLEHLVVETDEAAYATAMLREAAFESTGEEAITPTPVATPNTQSTSISHDVAPKVMEFDEDDDAMFERRLDEMIGDLTLDVKAVKTEKKPAPKADESASMFLDDMEINFEVEVDDPEPTNDGPSAEMPPPLASSAPGYQTFSTPSSEPDADLLAGLLSTLEAIETTTEHHSIVPEDVEDSAAMPSMASYLDTPTRSEDPLLMELNELLQQASPATALAKDHVSDIALDPLLQLQDELDNELNALMGEGTTFFKSAEPSVQAYLSASAQTAKVSAEFEDPELAMLSAELNSELSQLENEGLTIFSLSQQQPASLHEPLPPVAPIAESHAEEVVPASEFEALIAASLDENVPIELDESFEAMSEDLDELIAAEFDDEEIETAGGTSDFSAIHHDSFSMDANDSDSLASAESELADALDALLAEEHTFAQSQETDSAPEMKLDASLEEMTHDLDDLIRQELPDDEAPAPTTYADMVLDQSMSEDSLEESLSDLLAETDSIAQETREEQIAPAAEMYFGEDTEQELTETLDELLADEGSMDLSTAVEYELPPTRNEVDTFRVFKSTEIEPDSAEMPLEESLSALTENLDQLIQEPIEESEFDSFVDDSGVTDEQFESSLDELIAETAAIEEEIQEQQWQDHPDTMEQSATEVALTEELAALLAEEAAAEDSIVAEDSDAAEDSAIAASGATEDNSAESAQATEAFLQTETEGLDDNDFPLLDTSETVDDANREFDAHLQLDLQSEISAEDLVEETVQLCDPELSEIVLPPLETVIETVFDADAYMPPVFSAGDMSVEGSEEAAVEASIVETVAYVDTDPSLYVETSEEDLIQESFADAIEHTTENAEPAALADEDSAHYSMPADEATFEADVVEVDSSETENVTEYVVSEEIVAGEVPHESLDAQELHATEYVQFESAAEEVFDDESDLIVKESIVNEALFTEALSTVSAEEDAELEASLVLDAKASESTQYPEVTLVDEINVEHTDSTLQISDEATSAEPSQEQPSSTQTSAEIPESNVANSKPDYIELIVEAAPQPLMDAVSTGTFLLSDLAGITEPPPPQVALEPEVASPIEGAVSTGAFLSSDFAAILEATAPARAESLVEESDFITEISISEEMPASVHRSPDSDVIQLRDLMFFDDPSIPMGQPLDSASATGVFLASDLQRIITAPQPGAISHESASRPKILPELNGLWPDAEAELTARAEETAGEIEISLNEIVHLTRNDAGTVLFDLVEAEILNPGARKQYSKVAPLSSERKIDSSGLDAAVKKFSRDRKRLEEVERQVVEEVLEEHSLPVQPASHVRRIAALSIDLMFAAAVTGAYAWFKALPDFLKDELLLGQIPPLQETLPYLCNVALGFAVVWLALSTLLVASTGQTVGMRLFSMEVVNLKGYPVNLLQSMIRAMGQFTTVLTGGLGILPALGKSHRTLQDYLARTLVVHKEPVVIEELELTKGQPVVYDISE